MGIIQATLSDLAKFLGVASHQVETVVREEPSAQAALSRRCLFQSVGAVAAGTFFSDVPQPKMYYLGGKVLEGRIYSWKDITVKVNEIQDILRSKTLNVSVTLVPLTTIYYRDLFPKDLA